MDWRGYVAWHEVKRALGEHDVFMFCSLRDSFGSQFLEAMASGLPVVTLNHHGAADHIPNDAAIKVSVQEPERTVRELGDAVRYLYHNPAAREQLGINGARFAKSQEWCIRIKTIDVAYREVTNSTKTRTGPESVDRVKDSIPGVVHFKET